MATTASWLQTILTDVANAAKVPAEELAASVIKELLPTLVKDLTPTVTSVINSVLSQYPLAVLVEPEIDAAVSSVIAGLIQAIEAKLA